MLYSKRDVVVNATRVRFYLVKTYKFKDYMLTQPGAYRFRNSKGHLMGTRAKRKSFSLSCVIIEVAKLSRVNHLGKRFDFQEDLGVDSSLSSTHGIKGKP